MTVRAHLDGNPIDLQILADLFPTGDTRIVRDSDGAYLEATALDQWFTDGGRLREEADRILTRLMGAARHRNGSFRAVRLTGRFDRDARSQILAEDTFTFREEHTVASTGVAEMRAVAYAVAGVTDSASTPPPLPRGHRLLALMDTRRSRS